jgi:hypothetical protein
VSTSRLIGHLDCSTGVSGDKFPGAVLDAGAPRGAFTNTDVQAVLVRLAPEATVVVERVLSRGISALGVRVEAREQPAHRHWRDLRVLLGESGLPDPVIATSVRTFELLAQAEATAHDCPVDEVHFHEVGALDSILDVVGVCAGVHALGITRLSASHVATGWGTVATSHGVLPVPAPATVALLLDTPTVPGPSRPDGSAPGELTTPTGAALLAALASGYGACPHLTPRRVGYGAGTRDIGHPNVCRLVVGDSIPAPFGLDTENVVLLETNIDHLSGEAIAFTVDQLLAEGARDAWTSPIVMKKGRPSVTLSVLAAEETGSGGTAGEHLARRVVALTGTLGVRRTPLERFVATRESVVIDTPYGTVRVKVGPPDASERVRPEADDVARIARETQRGFMDIHRELVAAAESALLP